MKFFGVGLSILMLCTVPTGGQELVRRAQKDKGGSPAVATLDCTADSRQCPEVVIAGISAARLSNGEPSPFRGFADPSVRTDPVTGRLWMAYSWPNMHLGDQGDGTRKGLLRGRGRGRLGGRAAARPAAVPGVDINLAYSTDRGKTWHSQGPLWPSAEDTDRGGSGEPGYTDHEVVNLLPRQIDGRVTWYGIRLDYFLPAEGGFQRRPPGSLRLAIAEASSPDKLRDAPVQVLGSAATAKGWGVDVYLSSLSPGVRDCGLWNEPTLFAQDKTLYLGLRCLKFAGTVPKVSESDVVVFATEPTGEVRSWRWRYVGKLAGGAEARELGGVGMTQIDLARGVDGQLLLVTSPDDWNTGMQDFVHYGCRVTEVESIDPPKLARDSAGRLKVRATITASDTMPLGPGACTYDPASATGVLLVRRHKERGLMTASIHSTGMRP